MVASVQTFVALLALAFNSVLLYKDQSTLYSVVYFVAVKTVAELSKIYFEGIKPVHKISEVLQTLKLKKTKSRQDVPFSSRNCFHKCGRILYVTLRMLNISIFYYFTPFFLLFTVWFTKHHEEGLPRSMIPNS